MTLRFKPALTEVGTTFYNDDLNFSLFVENCQEFSPGLKYFPHVVVQNVFSWYVIGNFSNTELIRDKNLQVVFDRSYAVPKHEGYFEVDLYDHELLIWVRPTRSFKRQLVSFFHELVHFKHYLENGTPIDNEDEAYAEEKRLFDVYTKQPLAQTYLKSFGLKI